MAATHPLQTPKLISHLLRCALACVALAVVSFGLTFYMHEWLQGVSFWVYSLCLLSAITLSGSTYLLACYVLKVEGTQDFLRILKRKFFKRLKPA